MDVVFELAGVEKWRVIYDLAGEEEDECGKAYVVCDLVGVEESVCGL